MEIVNVVTAIVTGLAAILGPVLGKLLVSQRAKLDKADETLEVLGNGVRIIEKAVEDNKDLLGKSGAGDRVVRTIRTYGPVACQIVDSARSVAGTLRETSDASYVEAIVARERSEHAERERILAAESAEK